MFHSQMNMILRSHFHNEDTIVNHANGDFGPCAGSEVEGAGSVCDVPLPDEEQGVDVDPNEQLHLPKPIL